MTFPTRGTSPRGPVPSEVTTTDPGKGSSGIVQGVNCLVDSLLQALASLPFWVPSWLDRLALRAAKRLGREGKL